jgi:hypothetical protein
MSRFFRVLVVAAAVAAAPVMAQESKPSDPAQQADIRALLTLVDDAAAGKPLPSSVPLSWKQEHFIKSQGDRTYVPFTLVIDPPAFTSTVPVGLYLRVVTRGEAPPPPTEKKDPKAAAAARPQYPFEDVFFFELPATADGEPNVIRRAFAVSPGDYDVYIALKERGAAPATDEAAAASESSTAPATDTAPAADTKVAVLKHELSVPSFAGTELTTSTPIVAQTAEVLQQAISNERQSDNPYTFGQMRVIPSLDNVFTKDDELSVIFWVYNAATDPTSKKPDLQIDFDFNQKTAEGEKYFNKTAPQLLNADTLPPQFDLAAGHQLPGSLAVPLKSFPEGEYRLAVKIEDKIAGTSIARDVRFTVAAPDQK